MGNHSRDETKRQQIQDVVNRVTVGRGTERDYNALTDADLMTFSTGDQCSAIIDAAKQYTMPTEVWWSASGMLSIRWRQSPHRRKQPSAPRRADGTRKVKMPAGWNDDDNDA